MAKGSGLSIDSDPIGFFLHRPIVLNSFQDDKNNYIHHNKKKLLSNSMDNTIHQRSPPPPPPPTTLQFPVNLNRTGHDDDDHHHHRHDSPPSSSDQKRTVIDEMDFFADHKNYDHRSNANSSSAADNNGHREIQLNVNTGLNLLTTNTSSDQSVVDDGISPNIVEEKKAKSELERMNAENQRLKDMLNQVTSNYNTLQMHLMTLMQNQKADNLSEGHGVFDGKLELEKKNSENGGAVVPRQFMDLGLAATNNGDTDEPSLSSSEERRSGSAGNNIKNGHGDDQGPVLDQEKKEFDRGIGREDGPDQSNSHGWGPNKVPRLNSSKEADQTEATMRKARVSVRARSEAPMVQRCAEDRTILITTYEGNHSHPLPPAAMAMASTTSSAARMLLSGSMSSADGLMNPNFLARTILPCSSSMATISASAPFPTVTLDLTQSPNPLQHQRPPTQFHISFPNPSQNLANSPSSLLPQIFGQALYNQSKFSGLQMSQDMAEPAQLGHQPQPQQLGQHGSLTDTVSAATAAITADPNFTAALAAAITSIIGGGAGAHPNNSAAATTPTNNNTSSNANVTSSNSN
ncbi:hypothetical protein FEM48_ZijujUnG0103900 [Ziziphus jujuba var. spinosa]|uniref:WRKY domain-containing protein n=1 Tax=Ziziphus jujuba var. spinosa TaxID=714518 RepID=A0A978U861_ZIZJJ|nr:hypothetical protein FEM48_ZijujUnG0116900 [Ziziphus jujuba var. spinosa]KAH7510637.1 hypothetical protein FEM48_ZijujUnG0103900 [Ziziphus jujuba var. spinosa]